MPDAVGICNPHSNRYQRLLYCPNPTFIAPQDCTTAHTPDQRTCPMPCSLLARHPRRTPRQRLSDRLRPRRNSQQPDCQNQRRGTRIPRHHRLRPHRHSPAGKRHPRRPGHHPAGRKGPGQNPPHPRPGQPAGRTDPRHCRQRTQRRPLPSHQPRRCPHRLRNGRQRPHCLARPRPPLFRKTGHPRHLHRRPHRRNRPHQGCRRPPPLRRNRHPLRPRPPHQPRHFLHQRTPRPGRAHPGRPCST